MANDYLTTVRTRIDDIDAQIQRLITERAKLATEVAKAKYLEEENPIFYRPEREAEVLRKVFARNQGPLANETLSLVFQEIMSACLALQKPLTVAYLGPAGTYSQTAVLKHFGHAVQGIPLNTIEEVFREVEAGNVQYGIVPIENSIEGGVNQTLDCFIETSLKICAEVLLPIHHHLLSQAENLQTIQTLYSHQQSLAQCRKWLDQYLPQATRIAVNSNAEAARLALEHPQAAAIAGQSAAELYQLPMLASNIEDNINNTTRFAVLREQTVPPTGHDKTSLLITAVHADQPGSLFEILQPLAENKINLTRIESRPSRQNLWNYVFFIDIEGHIQDELIVNALEILKSTASIVKHLGSYPQAIK